MIVVTVAEMADAVLGAALLTLGVYVLKDRITRGWMILAFLVLQIAWAGFMLLFNFWTLQGWILVVNVLWMGVLIAGAKMALLTWRALQRLIRERDQGRLRSVLDRHERVD